MARKGENIRKRKDGRWEGRYKSGIRADGKVKYSSVYGKTYTETKKKLLECKVITTFQQHSKYTEHSLNEVMLLWLSSSLVKIKKSTEYKYRYMIDKHISPFLGKKKVSLLTASDINSFLYQKLKSGRLNGKGGLSPAYVKTMAIIIEASMKHASEEGLCNPLRAHILKPSCMRKEVSVMELSMQKRLESRLLTVVGRTEIGVCIALYAGLRIGEVCALAWEDVDLEKETIHVRHTVTREQPKKATAPIASLSIGTPKTDTSARDVPISSALLPLLKTAKEHSQTQYVVSEKSNFLSPRTFMYRYKKVLEQSGIPYINFHALRHPYVKPTTKKFAYFSQFSFRLRNCSLSSFSAAAKNACSFSFSSGNRHPECLPPILQ